jgi:hypothetical protein
LQENAYGNIRNAHKILVRKSGRITKRRSKRKGKIVLVLLTEHHAMKALDGSDWSASCCGRFTPKERAPGTHWIGGCVGPRAVLDAVVKRKIPSPYRESNRRTPIV